ncbi:MAG: 4-phosphoerythronate dehydrogenase [Fibrobacteria bacterium]
MPDAAPLGVHAWPVGHREAAGGDLKIWVDENIPMGKEAFADHGEVILFAGRGLTRADIAQADALIVRSITKVNAALLEGTPVRFVGTATIGIDHVDQEYLRSRSIGFASSPGCNANSVGEYVTAALTWLEIHKSYALAGKTLGIIGHGHVGKQVERKAAALGLRVLKCDPPLQDAARAAAQGKPGASPAGSFGYATLADLLAQSDIVTLHVPLTVSGPHPTLRLANADFFARLGRPIVLLNTCRGEVIDGRALIQALDDGRIRHLILDVFTGEPSIPQAIAARADLISPHIAGYSLQGKLNGTAQVARALRACFGFPTTWDPVFPAPVRPEIPYPGLPIDPLEPSASASESFAKTVSDEAFRQFCVHAAYDLPADDRRLRETFGEADPGKAFDRLRRDYPIRHEFPSFRIVGLPPEKRDLAFRLGELGFRVG